MFRTRSRGSICPRSLCSRQLSRNLQDDSLHPNIGQMTKAREAGVQSNQSLSTSIRELRPKRTCRRRQAR
eukprot:12884917-Prorocentrum_lima.AAC.1